MRRSILLACVIAGWGVAFFSGCKSESPRHIVTPEAMPREFLMRFSVIGDRTGDPQPGIYSRVVEQIQKMNPDFVWTVGDMIEGWIDDTTLVKQEWEEYLELITPLTTPVYFTPGNHDIWDTTSLELYRRYIGEPYFSFTTNGVHFICLDNSRWHRIDLFPQEQIDWLIDDLENNIDARYIFVFMHAPTGYKQ